MQVDGCRGLCIDASRVHNFHGSAANPSQNGTLRHSLPTTRLSFTSGRWTRPSMAGQQVSHDEQKWSILKLRFSAKPTRGPELGAHALKPHLTPDLCARAGCRSLFTVVFSFHSARVALKGLCMWTTRPFFRVLSDHGNTCKNHTGAAKAHDWACERLAAWFRSTGTKVKNQRGVTAVNGDKRGGS